MLQQVCHPHNQTGGNENMAKMTLPHHTNFRDKIEGGAPFSFSRDFLKRPTTTTSRKVVQFRAVGALLLLSHFEVRKSKSTLPNDICTTASCIIVHPMCMDFCEKRHFADSAKFDRLVQLIALIDHHFTCKSIRKNECMQVSVLQGAGTRSPAPRAVSVVSVYK